MPRDNMPDRVSAQTEPELQRTLAELDRILAVIRNVLKENELTIRAEVGTEPTLYTIGNLHPRIEGPKRAPRRL